MNHRGCADGTGGTQRMAQRNRAAHRVDGREGLRRERFVDFEQVIRKLALSLERLHVRLVGKLVLCLARDLPLPRHRVFSVLAAV